MFWNASDEQLAMRIRQKDVARYVKKYCDGSKPKLGWHDSDETNIQAVKGSKGRFDLMLGTLLVGKKYGRHVITNPYKLIAL